VNEERDNRERRAIDGLDWGQPAPSQAEVAPPPPPEVARQEPPRGHEQRRPGLAAFALVAGGAALAGGLVAALATVALVNPDSSPAPGSATTGAGQHITVQQTSAIADVAARGRPGVIKIVSTRRSGPGIEQDVGSGVVMDVQGHVVTNAHVVLGTENLRAILPDGSERPAILIGHDYPFTDVAVLQVGPGSLTPIAPGDSSALVLGETVVAIGNPLSEFDGSVSVGVVSGLNRHQAFDGVSQDDLIQTDAALNNGNSGGALLNLQGQFIGMPTSVLRQAGSSQSVEGIGFALPSNRVMAIAQGIIAAAGQYPRPDLGIEHVDIDAGVLARAPRLASDKGALVTRVVSGGPAGSAGIAIGDIITRVGNHDIDEGHMLLNALEEFQPGETVKVVLNRNGRIIETEVRLAKKS
jgi:2-alkenal reductase